MRLPEYLLATASLLAAVISSHIALDLATTYPRARGWHRRATLVGAALTFGLGFWAMHFISMFGFEVAGTDHRYGVFRVTLSALVGIGAAGGTLYLLRAEVTRVRVWVAALLFSAGLLSTHGLGMLAMLGHSALTFVHDPGWTALSFLTAGITGWGMVQYYVAGRDRRSYTILRHGAASVILGGSAWASHYVALAGTDYTWSRPKTGIYALLYRYAADAPSTSAESLSLAVFILVAAFVLLAGAYLYLRIDAQVARRVEERRHYERVAQMDRKYMDLVQYAPIPFAVYDEAGTFRYVNVQCDELFGGSLLGRRMQDHLRVEDREWVWKRIEHAMLTGEVTTFAEIPTLMLDGQWRVLNCHVTRCEWQGKPALQVLTVDVTRQVEATQVQKRAYETALRAEALKDEFLAVISHELRTPLTAVLGYGELLRDEIVGPLNAEQKDMLDRMDQSGQHLLTLIEQTLDIQRAAKGEPLPLHIDAVDVRALLERTVTIMQPLAGKKSLALYLNVPMDRQLMDTDAGKLRQILLNLLSNAIKFTEHGSVTVEALVRKADVRLRIRDTGIGIAPSHLGRIYEPFFRVDSTFTRREEGAGLGLAITRDLVKALGGVIRVTSTVGEGTMAEIILPRYQEAMAA